MRTAFIFAILIGFFHPAPMSAQVVGATISGTVTDPSGSKMAGVTVTISNTGTGIATTTETKAEGSFGVPNLQPGNYEVAASAKGFSTLVRKGITLTVGQELILNLALQVGSMNEQVTVTAEAPTVNLANATISGVIEQKTVAELPLNGRSWTDLAILQPGVHQSQNQPPINAGDRVKRGLGLELTISGARPQQNNYLLDGVNINDYANAGPGSVLGGNLGTDAVAEFSVLTTNYSTEYGRTSGGIITATTKSGTNQFHGSAYEFLRNDALDATSAIDKLYGNSKPPFRRNQYGASGGGPIQKDKTFIFGDYEGVTQSLGTTTSSNVPSTDARNGILNCPYTVNASTCPVTPVDANIVKLFNSGLIPKGNVPGGGPGVADVPGSGFNSAIFALTLTQKTQENFFIVRADHTFSPKDRIFATYLFDKASQSEPDQYDTVLIHNPMFREMVSIEENHVFSPSLLNSFRVGFNRDNVESPSNATAINPAAADPALGFIPGSTIGAITINDGTGGYTGGLAPYAPFKFHWNSFQYYDNLFYTKGIHSVKFGANLERIQSNTLGQDFPGGQIIYNTLYDFLTNGLGANSTGASINADVPGGVTGRGVRQWIAGAYVQDDIHLRPNLSVNIGLRYEMASVINEVDNKLANLRVLLPGTVGSAGPPVVPPTGVPGTPQYPNYTGSPYILNPTKKNFEPRIGFAWDPFKDGKTSVAGGFGIFDVLPFPVEMGSGVDSTAPFNLAVSATGLKPSGGAMQFGCASACGAYGQASGANSFSYYVMQFDPKRNYVMQFNFNVQRQITPNTTLMVGYVGARGIHMRFQADDNNMVYPDANNSTQGPFTSPLTWPCSSAYVPTTATVPNSTKTYQIQLCNSGPGVGVLNPNMGRTQMALWDGQYWYNGLQVQLNKAMSRSFEVGGSYTYSKNMDTGGGSVASDPFRNSVSTLLWFCKSCRRGLSDQDQRHNLTVHYQWDIPTPSSFGKPLKMVLGDWETGGVFTMASGTPFTVLLAGDPLGMSTTDPYQYPDKVPGADCKNPVNPQNAVQYIKLQCFTAPLISTQLGNSGRNNAIGPGLVNLDFSLFKNIPIHEALKAQFRAEMFNVTNRPNYNSPNDNRAILNSDGTINTNIAPGKITLLNIPSRQIQFALKLTW
ncbi:MAG TPA: TonB-dependent receptor [Candidatus Saccharimonadales bacterium]|nr:TonB-dependent receptor [Candidatus Saccharimonadales bacterium]